MNNTLVFVYKIYYCKNNYNENNFLECKRNKSRCKKELF